MDTDTDEDVDTDEMEANISKRIEGNSSEILFSPICFKAKSLKRINVKIFFYRFRTEVYFGQRSPAGNVSGDQALVDDDSDGPEDKDTFYDTNATMPMTVDSNEITDMTDMTDKTDKTDKTDRRDSTNDLIYHQCKTASRTSFVDRLVSVPVGNLTDHDGSCWA